MALEPIREIASDNAKERALATFLQKHMNWELFPRICFRCTDGLLMLPVIELARLQPEVHTRRDTNETDLVVKVRVSDYINFFRPLVIDEG
jgi:hypothetical protein